MKNSWNNFQGAFAMVDGAVDQHHDCSLFLSNFRFLKVFFTNPNPKIPPRMIFAKKADIRFPKKNIHAEWTK
jgi:hypothetical protein